MKTDTNNQETPTRQDGSKVGCSSLLAERNLEASELVREEVKQREEGEYLSWRYIDFVNEDRFLSEIVGDEGVKDNMTAEELAEYAIEQIYS